MLIVKPADKAPRSVSNYRPTMDIRRPDLFSDHFCYSPLVFLNQWLPPWEFLKRKSSSVYTTYRSLARLARSVLSLGCQEGSNDGKAVFMAPFGNVSRRLRVRSRPPRPSTGARWRAARTWRDSARAGQEDGATCSCCSGHPETHGRAGDQRQGGARCGCRHLRGGWALLLCSRWGVVRGRPLPWPVEKD